MRKGEDLRKVFFCEFMKVLFASVLFVTASYAFAQGGPPLLTDDPGTVEKGKWELNMAWIYRRLPGATEIELPHFDASHGISDRANFKIEVPWVFRIRWWGQCQWRRRWINWGQVSLY